MSTEPLLLILQDSPLRAVSEPEALETLSAAELGQPRRLERIDTRHVADDIDGGHWRSSHTFIREAATHLRSVADDIGAGRMRYFGIAEVPHLIALGAYLSDERLLEAVDFDRDRNRWEWRAEEKTLEVEIQGLPRESVALPGPAVLRVEISYAVHDGDIDAVLGQDRLAEIRISPKERAPAPGIVQSFADVQVVRAALREALATLAALRPNTEVIHLFVAAPVSVCLAVGQELRLRNGRDVQTYRFRSGGGGPALTPAILLTNGEISEMAAPLSAAQQELAQQLRSIWSAALSELREHAHVLKASADTRRWYAGFQSAPMLASILPFPDLKPIWELIGDHDRIAATSVPEFAFVKESREWQLNDELILGMFEAADRDEDRLRAFARLFLWHEYVHDWQGVTSYTSAQIGQLSNCLERADYIADAYALFHQLDFLVRQLPQEAASPDRLLSLLAQQTSVALRSFWVFEAPAPFKEMQERRLRRYLNWYWRRAQFLESRDLAFALQLLATQPCIEVSGLRRRLGGGNRVNVVVGESRDFGRLHIGIMLENGRLERRGSSTDASIEELMRAFSRHDRESIERFFNALIDHLKHGGGVFPQVATRVGEAN